MSTFKLHSFPGIDGVRLLPLIYSIRYLNAPFLRFPKQFLELENFHPMFSAKSLN